MRNNQSGTGLVEILLIILIISILGFAGYFVWNMNQSKQTNNANINTPGETIEVSTEQQAKQTTDQSTKLLDGVMDKALGVAVSFKYPKAWKYDMTQLSQDQDSIGQVVTITSPNGAIEVIYDVNNYGLGGRCMPEERGIISELSVEDIVGFSQVKFVEVAGGTTNRISLMTTDKTKDAAVGKSECTLYLADVVGLGKPNGVHMITSINPKDHIDISTTLDRAEFDTVINDPSYAEAKAILLSTVVK